MILSLSSGHLQLKQVNSFLACIPIHFLSGLVCNISHLALIAAKQNQSEWHNFQKFGSFAFTASEKLTCMQVPMHFSGQVWYGPLPLFYWFGRHLYSLVSGMTFSHHDGRPKVHLFSDKGNSLCSCHSCRHQFLGMLPKHIERLRIRKPSVAISGVSEAFVRIGKFPPESHHWLWCRNPHRIQCNINFMDSPVCSSTACIIPEPNGKLKVERFGFEFFELELDPATFCNPRPAVEAELEGTGTGFIQPWLRPKHLGLNLICPAFQISRIDRFSYWRTERCHWPTERFCHSALELLPKNLHF